MKQGEQIFEDMTYELMRLESYLGLVMGELIEEGYELDDIYGNFMLDYIDSGKYIPGLETLVFKANPDLFLDLFGDPATSNVAHNVSQWQEEKKEISFLQSQLKRDKKTMIYMNVASLIGFSMALVILLSCLPSLPDIFFMGCILSGLAFIDISTFLEVLSLNSRISELNIKEDELNKKIKKHTKLKEDFWFKEYSKGLQTYLEDLYKWKNYKNSNPREDKKKVLEMYKNILESMKPINKLENKPELVKSYMLKR